MKQKDSQNQLLLAQSGWEMLDSLGDKIIEEAVTGVASDALSSIPGGTIVMGLYKGFRKISEEKKYKNFISFIKSYKTNTDKEINEYLKQNPTSELGEYTFSMLEDLSSPRQTEMLGRATALLLNKAITEKELYEYGYIITKLDPYLFQLVLELRKKYTKDERGRENLSKKFELAMSREGLYIQNPNQDLLSFGFLDAKEIEMNAGMETFPERQYEVNSKYKKFYDQIIIGEKCTK